MKSVAFGLCPRAWPLHRAAMTAGTMRAGSPRVMCGFTAGGCATGDSDEMYDQRCPCHKVQAIPASLRDGGSTGVIFTERATCCQLSVY